MCIFFEKNVETERECQYQDDVSSNESEESFADFFEHLCLKRELWQSPQNQYQIKPTQQDGDGKQVSIYLDAVHYTGT